MSDIEMEWVEAAELGLRGQGFKGELEHPYDRLPKMAKSADLPEWIFRLGQKSAGLYVDFKTNSPFLEARVVLRYPGEPEFHYRKYLDLYALDGDRWRWAGGSLYGVVPSGATPLVSGLSTEMRTYRLYLPSFFALERLEIGYEKGSDMIEVPAPQAKPVGIYGTSIVHGMSASKPGMVFTSILGRRLGVEVINLGFSGSARCEPALAEVFSSLKPKAWVIDPMANMNLKLIEENAPDFLNGMIEQHSDIPFLMVEDRLHSNLWMRPEAMEQKKRKWQAWRDLYGKLQSKHKSTFMYQEGASLLAEDDMTVDGSHPTDLGYRCMADQCQPHWEKLLGIGEAS